MKKNLLVIFATPAEAAASLQLTQATPLSNNLYAFSHGKILLTGMGVESTRKSLTQAIEEIQQADAILNFGIAGALKKHIATGKFLIINHCSYKQDTIQLQDKEMGMHLLTVDDPLHDEQERDRLSSSYDLVDMEGYVITEIAKAHSKPCALYKIVSDYCDHKASATIKQQLPRLSEILANYMKCTINEIRNVTATGNFI